MIAFRKATKKDIGSIVEMLANDKLGSEREVEEVTHLASYYNAFNHIESDPNQELMILEDEYGSIMGTFQLSFIQYLTYQGGLRAQIEAVRIHKDHRGEGLGKYLFEWVIDRAKKRGAHLIQLTTDKKRPQAISFYEDLGFTSSHEGMKLHLK